MVAPDCHQMSGYDITHCARTIDLTAFSKLTPRSVEFRHARSPNHLVMLRGNVSRYFVPTTRNRAERSSHSGHIPTVLSLTTTPGANFRLTSRGGTNRRGSYIPSDSSFKFLPKNGPDRPKTDRKSDSNNCFLQ